MTRFALLCGVVIAALAFAGETNIGTTYASDGGTANNQYTNTGTNTFAVRQLAKLTVHCDQNSYICVNALPCNATNGIPISVNVPVTTSCSDLFFYTPPDAGSYSGCLVANAPNETDGGVVSKCYWKTRVGTEGP